LNREVIWKMVCQRHLVFDGSNEERASIFHNAQFVEAELRSLLPGELAHLPLKVDLARHIHRPDTRGASQGQNFLYDPGREVCRPLTDDQLFRQLPISHRICRIYAHDDNHAPQLATALDTLLGSSAGDDLTNM
jgi:hypothetical protein